MSLLVLAYPQMSQQDYSWIQDIRKKCDGRYFETIKPHFTIVFPVHNVKEPVFIKHVETISRYFKEISFSLKCTIVVKDSLSEYTDIFLVPDKGCSEIIKLHDKMYTGILAPELRLDIPFIPHIGIGGSANAMDNKIVSDKINETMFCINGTISSLDIAWYEHPEIKTLKKIRLFSSNDITVKDRHI